MTNNFERILGNGGFGTVYRGFIDSTQVAVKKLSPSSVQGYQQFQAEVKLLMTVHHRNLTSLIGPEQCKCLELGKKTSNSIGCSTRIGIST
ncbi:Tyrosine-protein kinase [Parasponia andersonii]|uniref:Tyrosine-protein kinase n=1 Tax=Parasponia andersonii TaxID=3476 RepID=A0A2P5ASY3_PARAD|nr:Tyrosine-protein kinase [Parasponia andersonii]